MAAVPDPTKPLPPASDPWEGRAAVPRPFEDPAPSGPQVIFVEVQRKRRWPWVLGIFGLLMVLCCGLCGVIVSPLLGEYPSSVAATPSEVDGLKRDDSTIVQLLSAEANFRLRASEYVDGSFANRFEDPKNKDRSVITFGGTGLIWDPPKTLDGAIKGQGGNLRNVKDFPPGKHGGLLKCGDGKDKDKDVVMCAWIDHGSMGIGVFYGKRPMADDARFMRALREAVIIRP
jgi:hypothetical protein